ncbi:hypothetical protein AB0395_44810 [Streptosporangium sp. NPDC051023]|uniref:hypothetical protein n=1 Tax=Streptosporangium sp. NPDC051023 TaxID=3155410 RepID=UPI00344EC589
MSAPCIVGPRDIPPTMSVSGMFERYTELGMRGYVARTEDSVPLTVAEHLELLTLGESIARIVRHPVDVHHALQAGATWPQVAHALEINEQDARSAYRRWADGQRALHEHCGIGLDAAEHAEAIARAEQTGEA